MKNLFGAGMYKSDTFPYHNNYHESVQLLSPGRIEQYIQQIIFEPKG